MAEALTYARTTFTHLVIELFRAICLNVTATFSHRFYMSQAASLQLMGAVEESKPNGQVQAQ